ncbi:MAG: ion transporter [Pseudomonadota bacterium]|nr:ion transporter [Pseudomonadota bacterium]
MTGPQGDPPHDPPGGAREAPAPGGSPAGAAPAPRDAAASPTSPAARRRDAREAAAEAPRPLRRLRRWLYVQLDPDGWPGDGLSPLNLAATAAVMVSTLAAALLTEPTLAAWNGWLYGAMLGSAVLFTLEFAARLWVKWESPRMRADPMGPLRWLTRWYTILDLLALVGIWVEVGVEAGFGLTVMLRLMRVLHVFHSAGDGAVARAGREIARAVAERRMELAIAVCVAGLALVGASVAMYAAEGQAQPEAFGSIPRAMWWSVVTLTTVGYGDAIPVTPAGRLIAGLTALGSVALVALPAGIMAAAFSDALQRARRRPPGRED